MKINAVLQTSIITIVIIIIKMIKMDLMIIILYIIISIHRDVHNTVITAWDIDRLATTTSPMFLQRR